jgi:hypothetical protein
MNLFVVLTLSLHYWLGNWETRFFFSIFLLRKLKFKALMGCNPSLVILFQALIKRIIALWFVKSVCLPPSYMVISTWANIVPHLFMITVLALTWFLLYGCHVLSKTFLNNWILFSEAIPIRASAKWAKCQVSFLYCWWIYIYPSGLCSKVNSFGKISECSLLCLGAINVL